MDYHYEIKIYCTRYTNSVLEGDTRTFEEWFYGKQKLHRKIYFKDTLGRYITFERLNYLVTTWCKFFESQRHVVDGRDIMKYEEWYTNMEMIYNRELKLKKLLR